MAEVASAIIEMSPEMPKKASMLGNLGSEALSGFDLSSPSRRTDRFDRSSFRITIVRDYGLHGRVASLPLSQVPPKSIRLGQPGVPLQGGSALEACHRPPAIPRRCLGPVG